MARREPVRLSVFDARGRTVASGSYLCRLETPSATRTLKITRLVGD